MLADDRGSHAVKKHAASRASKPMNHRQLMRCCPALKMPT